MNRYFRAVGFLNNFTRAEYEKLVEDIMFRPDISLGSFPKGAGSMVIDKNLECGMKKGICVRIVKDDTGSVYREAVFPYFRTEKYIKHDSCSFEKKLTGEEYLGVYEDLNLGENLFFYVLNADEVIKRGKKNASCEVSISALSIAGNVILPIKKNDKQREDVIEFNNNRIRLLNKANDGDQNAFATVRHDDIMTNVTVSEQIYVESMDIYSVVDSSFIPCGAECDLYSVLGDIVSVQKDRNTLTGEMVYILDVCVKGISLPICINEKDLLGEPQKGFRFKGTVWLQGYIKPE